MAVRRESVRIDVDSNLAAVAARDAAAVKLLATNLDSLSRSGVQTDRSTQKIASGLDKTAKSADNVDRSTRRAGSSIDQLTGRLRVMADVASILGPALIPIGALAVPALTGLANQLGFAAAAGGTAILAFQGVGDAVTAMNEYAFAPTEANAAKLEETLAKLSPAAQEFAARIGEMRGELVATRDAAATGLFSELTPAMDDFEGLLGRVQPVLQEIGSATGAMLADGLASLNSDRWQPFFDFLQSEARPILTELGATVGDFGHGLSNLWMAFQPLNRDFSGWLADVASGFDDWSASLAGTEGFNDFIDYIRTSGPQVADTMGALGKALVAIAEAAAPLGGPALAGIEAFADAVSAVANSDIGTPIFAAVAALALFNRAMAVGRGAMNAFGQTRGNLTAISGSLDGLGRSSGRASGNLTRLAATASGVGAVAVAVGVLGDALFEASGAKIDTANLARDVEALANGADPKLLEQVGDSLSYMNSTVAKGAEPFRELTSAFGLLWDTPMDKHAAQIKDLDQQLAGLVESGNADQAAAAFQRLMEAQTGMPEGTSFSDSVRDNLLGTFTGYATALDNAEAANEGYADSTDAAADAAAAAKANVNALANAMRTQAAEALSAFDAQTAWGQAVADAREQASKGAKGIDEMTESGRANRDALSGLASSWNAQSRAVKNNVGEYREARQTFMDVADSMGIGAGQARRLANQMIEMPRSLVLDFEMRGLRQGIRDSIALGVELGGLNATNAKPKVTAQTQNAGAALGALIGTLGRVNGYNAKPSVNANTGQAGAALGALIGQLQLADGYHATSTTTHTITTIRREVRVGVGIGAATGLPRAYGGPVVGPGTERSDNILTPTSPGEWVHQAPAVRYYGQQFMDDINNMRIDRNRFERQGVQAAMRSTAGRVSVSAGGTFRARLDLPDGRQLDMDLIDQRIDSRIQDWRDDGADFADDLSGRSADL